MGVLTHQNGRYRSTENELVGDNCRMVGTVWYRSTENELVGDNCRMVGTVWYRSTENELVGGSCVWNDLVKKKNNLVGGTHCIVVSTCHSAE